MQLLNTDEQRKISFCVYTFNIKMRFLRPISVFQRKNWGHKARQLQTFTNSKRVMKNLPAPKFLPHLPPDLGLKCLPIQSLMSSRAKGRSIILELKHTVSQNIRKVVSRFIEITGQTRSQRTFSSCFLLIHTFYRCDSWILQAISYWLITQQINGVKMWVSNSLSRGFLLCY